MSSHYIKIQLSVLVLYKVDIIITSLNVTGSRHDKIAEKLLTHSFFHEVAGWNHKINVYQSSWLYIFSKIAEVIKQVMLDDIYQMMFFTITG